MHYRGGHLPSQELNAGASAATDDDDGRNGGRDGGPCLRPDGGRRAERISPSEASVV